MSDIASPAPQLKCKGMTYGSGLHDCGFSSDLEGPAMGETGICVVTCWQLLLCDTVCVCKVKFIWPCVYKMQSKSSVQMEQITMMMCSFEVSLLPPYLLTVLKLSIPSQVISILHRRTAEAKSTRERVLIRGMESWAYGALPPLWGHYWAAMGSRLEPLPVVSHSNSALMFERARKMPTLHGYINIL